MAICAGELAERKELKKNTLVATVMSNVGLERAVAKWGVKVVRTKVGDRYVVEELRKHGYSLGGEQSGHLVFMAHATTGDGTLAALQVLAVMARQGKPMSELTKIFQPSPQILLNFPVKEKRELAHLAEPNKVIRAVEKKLGKDGRVLVRYSGTEPKVRVLVEGPDAKQIRQYAEEIGASLQRALG
jgi:phosphoglucosamine mutase